MKWITQIWIRACNAYASRYEPGGLRVLADLYWGMLLALAALLLLCSILYGGYALYTTFPDFPDAAGTPQKVPTPSLDRAKLQATLDTFSARQAEYDALKSNPPVIADPK